jgi:hypothetical protein
LPAFLRHHPQLTLLLRVENRSNDLMVATGAARFASARRRIPRWSRDRVCTFGDFVAGLLA